jgi:hypothetical protein
MSTTIFDARKLLKRLWIILDRMAGLLWGVAVGAERP